MQRIPELYFAQSDLHGRGVFVSGDVPADSLLEVCPVLVIPAEEVPQIDNTILHDYYFYWGKEEQSACIVLGLGSLFNHSATPNVECIPDYANHCFQYFSIQDIKAGEELTIDYHGGNTSDTDSKLWFDVS